MPEREEPRVGLPNRESYVMTYWKEIDAAKGLERPHALKTDTEPAH